MSRYLRPSLGESFGYSPGEQPRDGEGWIKLNTNESSARPSPTVADAVRAAALDLNRYPSPVGEPLRGELAAHHGVEPDQVALGNGADGLIDAAFRAFCEPGSTVVLTDPTYSLLPVVARLHGVRPRVVSLGEGGELPAELATAPGSLRFLVNPNSPTGTWIAPALLAERLAGTQGVVVIDEAYCDFAPASFIPLLREHPSWLVLRTFSKSYALAGLRVGYAVGSAELVRDLQAVGESYPVDRCAIAGARAALADAAHHDAIVESVVSERRRLGTRLLQLGWRVTDSQANFVCARPGTGNADEVAAHLRTRRVLVRHFGTGSESLMRITVGTPEENDSFLAGLE